MQIYTLHGDNGDLAAQQVQQSQNKLGPGHA